MTSDDTNRSFKADVDTRGDVDAPASVVLIGSWARLFSQKKSKAIDQRMIDRPASWLSVRAAVSFIC